MPDLTANDVLLNAYVEWANMDEWPHDGDFGTFAHGQLREAGYTVERRAEHKPALVCDRCGTSWPCAAVGRLWENRNPGEVGEP